MEIRVEYPKYRTAPSSGSTAPNSAAKGIKPTCKGHLHTYVNCSAIHSTWVMVSAEVTISNWMTEENVYIYVTEKKIAQTWKYRNITSSLISEMWKLIKNKATKIEKWILRKRKSTQKWGQEKITEASEEEYRQTMLWSGVWFPELTA